MKILITGGSSSLAIRLRPMLANTGNVITAGRNGCDVFLDLNTSGKIALPEADVIIHTAAHFGGNTDDAMIETEFINTIGTLKLCQAANQSKTTYFVLISSIFASLKEDAHSYSIYALSKRHAEDVARFYCAANNIRLVIIRPSQLYGNEENFRKHQPFFYTMADKAEKGEDIFLYGSNDAKRNYIHCDDVATIIAKTIQHNIEGTYACMSETDVTYSQVAVAMFSAFGKGGKVVFLKDKPDIPDNVFEKENTLYKKINYHPSISIEEGIRRLATYRSLHS